MTRCSSRRGVAVFVVLVVIAIGALAGTVALLSARAASEGASLSATRLQSRLTMRSGVLALQQLAIEQRTDVLAGADFDASMPMEIFTEGDRIGLVQLDDSITPQAVSLDALLDVNTATASMLAKLPGMDETLGSALAAVLPVSSIGGLIEAEGVTIEMVFGEYDEMGRLTSEVPPLASLLTVGSIDPSLSRGVGSVAPGQAQINAAAEFTDETRAQLDQRLDPQAGGSLIAGLLEQADSAPTSRAELGRSLRSAQFTLATGGQIFDALCFGDEPVAGRVDINRAPIEVLAVIPGFDEDGVAQRLVDARQNLSPEDLASVLWPLEQGLVDESGMLSAVDRVTTRSVRWVLRAQAGVSVERERSVGIDTLEDAQRARAGMDDADTDRLQDRVAMDLLVDFSGPSPRVIPLGEVSIAGELASVARAMRAGGDGFAPIDEGDFEADPMGGPPA